MTRPKPTFEEWKKLVNYLVENICGVDCDALPDWDYYTAWEDGVSPATAAKRVVANAKRY